MVIFLHHIFSEAVPLGNTIYLPVYYYLSLETYFSKIFV
jgi:hypothetical protein